MNKENNHGKEMLPSSVRKKLIALEQYLSNFKSVKKSKISHSKTEINDDVVNKISKFVKIIDYKNHKTDIDKNQKLKNLLADLKTKSLYYQMEAMLIENIYNKKISKEKHSKSAKEDLVKRNNLRENCNLLYRSHISLHKNFRIIDKIGEYVNKYVTKASVNRALLCETNNLIEESIIKLMNYINLKDQNLETINACKIYCIQNSNLKMKLTYKNYTTFMYYKKKSETISDDNSISKKSRNFLTRPSVSQHNCKELSKDNINTESEINNIENDIVCKQDCNNCSYTQCDCRHSNCKFVDNITHSISEIHAKECQMDATINSSLSITPNEVLHEESPESYKNLGYIKVPKFKRILKIIKHALKLNNGENTLLRFIYLEKEMFVPVKALDNYYSYEEVYKIDENNCYSTFIGLKRNLFEIPILNYNELKIRRNKTISQLMSAPISFNKLFSDNTTNQKDNRIIHIEKFCNCQINLNKNIHRFVEKPSPTTTEILIYYNIVKGNDIGCFNMLRRLIETVTCTLKLIKEIKMTIDGCFQETIYK